MNKIYVIIGVLLIVGTAGGCTHDNRPSSLIQEDLYINLLAELQLVNSYSRFQSADSLAKDSLVQEVLNHYGVTRVQFKQSHLYYQNQTEKQKERIDRAIERLRMDAVRDTAGTNSK